MKITGQANAAPVDDPAKQGMAEAMSSIAPPRPEPFTLTRPTGEAGPLVFASPHSGDVYPDDLDVTPTLSEASLRSAEDALVDRLIAASPAHGVPLIAGRISRAYVDLNRDPAELDAALIDDCEEAPATAKVAAGFGVIPRRAGDGAALYDRRLGRAEAEGRLSRIHSPYHAALDDLMRSARIRHGQAILIDWHSMPSRAAGGRGRSVKGVDVILGDRHGASCAARLTRRLRALFEGLGWSVGLNQPYAGGYSTQIWGRPDEGFQALQIELNRALYLDEKALRPSADFDRCQTALSRVIAALSDEDWRAD